MLILQRFCHRQKIVLFHMEVNKMRIAGQSANNYFSANLYASQKLGMNTLGNMSSLYGSGSSLNYSSLLGSSTSTSSSVPSLNDVLTSTYQFSNTMKTSTMAMQNAAKAVQGFSQEAIDEKAKNGQVSSSTLEDIYKTATTFAKSYNSSVNSLYYAPSYSSYVQGIESTMRSAAASNLTALNNLGFSQESDGTLTIDEEKFKKAVQDNPNALKDLFSQSGNFMQTLEKANTQALDSRAINKSEISLAVKENYLTYMNPTASMNNYSSSIGYLFNSLA